MKDLRGVCGASDKVLKELRRGLGCKVVKVQGVGCGTLLYRFRFTRHGSAVVEGWALSE